MVERELPKLLAWVRFPSPAYILKEENTMKILKLTGIILSLLLILLISGVIALVTLVDPNRLKPMITAQVEKYTGRKLLIDGDLNWKFFPYLGVSIKNAKLENTPEFNKTVFAEIDHATVGVRLLPLLHSQIESSGIVLDGIRINLIKKADGTTNWQDLAPQSQEKNNNSAKSSAALGIAIAGLDISHANISYDDKQTKQSFEVKNFQLHAKDISLINAFPMDASFQLLVNQPKVVGTFSIHSDIGINLNKQVYTLENTELTTNINNIKSTVKMNLKADLTKELVQITHLVGQIANVNLAGQMNVTHLNQSPQTLGNLKIQPFDLKAFLKETGLDIAALETGKNVRATVNFSGTLPSKIQVNTFVKMDELKYSSITTTNINGKIYYDNGMVRIDPLTADFYKGTIQSQGNVNIKSTAMPAAIKFQLANVQAESLFKALATNQQKITATGTANANLDITMSLKAASPVNSLNGKGNFAFNNGAVQGVDITYLLDSAYALAKRQSFPSNNSNKTDFGTLTGTILIKNGIVTNDDLKITSPRFDTNGKGKIDLVSKRIDYSLQSLMKKTDANQKNGWQNLYGLPIPIRITGNLSDPNIQLDTSVLAKAVVKQQITNAAQKVEAKLQEKIKGKLPGNAGELIQNLLGQ